VSLPPSIVAAEREADGTAVLPDWATTPAPAVSPWMLALVFASPVPRGILDRIDGALDEWEAEAGHWCPEADPEADAEAWLQDELAEIRGVPHWEVP
jgi:hypothetical protein